MHLLDDKAQPDSGRDQDRDEDRDVGGGGGAVRGRAEHALTVELAAELGQTQAH